MESGSLIVLFLRYEMVEGHAEYVIQVSDQEQTWTIKCRYSKLADVHAALKGINKKLPDFPPKKMFGSSNPSFISQRQAGLQHYIKTLLEGGSKYNIKPLIELLKSGKKAVAQAKVDSSQPAQLTKAQPTNKRDESANAEQEIFRNFSKKLVQILKKNENYLLDETNEPSRNTRDFVTQKHIFEKKRNFRIVAFPEDLDLEDAILKKIAAKAGLQLNDVIKNNLVPLPKDSEFVQELPN